MSILKNEINTYAEAVKRIVLIQDCIKSNTILKCKNEEEKFNNLTQINSLQESVENIQKSKQQNHNFQTKGKFKKIHTHNFHNKHRKNIGNVKQNFGRGRNSNTIARRNFRGRSFKNKYTQNNHGNIK